MREQWREREDGRNGVTSCRVRSRCRENRYNTTTATTTPEREREDRDGRRLLVFSSLCIYPPSALGDVHRPLYGLSGLSG